MPILTSGSSTAPTTPSPLIGWIVEVDADPDTTGEFVIGQSLLGGTDLLAASERWIQIPTLQVKKVSVRRGGGQASRSYDAGEAVVELDNRSGNFDPDNPNSFYVMGSRRLLAQGTGLRVRATPGGFSSSLTGTYDDKVTADGAISAWPLDDLTGAVAFPSNGSNNGTYNGSFVLGGAPIGPGLGPSVTFNGGHVETGFGPSTLNAPFSAEVWFSPSSTVAPTILVSTRTPPEFAFDMQLVSDGTKFTGLFGNFGNGSSFFTSATVATGLNIVAGSLNHVVYTVSTTAYTVYLNGVLVGSGALAGTTRFWDTGRRLRIAALGSTGAAFLGRMSNVAVYPSVLSPAQVADHYTYGTSVSLSASSMFQGYIDNIQVEGHWAVPTAVFTASDLMANLANIDVPEQVGATGGGSTSSVRAHWLLDQAGVPATKRNVEAGGRACLGTSGGGSVRTELERVASGEAGRFFVSRDGVVTLTWHDAEYAKVPTVNYLNTNGAASPRYESIATAIGNVGIVNSATVHRIVPKVRDDETGQYSEGPALPDVGAENSTSVGAYGRRATQVDVVLQDDIDVNSLAQYLANRRAEPVPRITSLVSVPLEAMDTALAQAVLQLELGDLITLTQHTIDGRQLVWVANVENIAFDHDSPLTQVTFATAPSDTAGLFTDVGWFIIGESLLGGTDVLAPY